MREPDPRFPGLSAAAGEIVDRRIVPMMRVRCRTSGGGWIEKVALSEVLHGYKWPIVIVANPGDVEGYGWPADAVVAILEPSPAASDPMP